MTAEELAARVDALEKDRDRLVDLIWRLVNAVQVLAQAAGARPSAEAEPTRAALRLIRGDADPGSRAL